MKPQRRLRVAGDALSLCFAKGGKGLLCGTDRGALILWDVDSGTQLANVSADCGEILSMALTSDGKRLITGNADTTALVWNIDTLEAVQRPKPPVRPDEALQRLQMAAMFNGMPPGIWLWNALPIFFPPIEVPDDGEPAASPKLPPGAHP